MPRGKKEVAEQITPELREVEGEVGRGKAVLEAAARRCLAISSQRRSVAE